MGFDPDISRETDIIRLMDAYGGMLTGLCSALLKDRDLAQDMVQETFVRAWKHLDELRGGKQSEKAWLCRIAVNLCRDFQRTRWFRLVEKKAEMDETALWYDPAGEEASAVMETLGTLKTKYREVLTLHYFQNLSAEEIGQIAGLSASAVYRRLNKAKKLLRQQLKGWENDG